MLEIKDGIEYYPVDLLNDGQYGYGVKNIWTFEVIEDETGEKKYALLAEEAHEIAKGNVNEVLDKLVYNPTYETNSEEYKEIATFNTLDEARTYAHQNFPEINLEKVIKEEFSEQENIMKERGF